MQSRSTRGAAFFLLALLLLLSLLALSSALVIPPLPYDDANVAANRALGGQIEYFPVAGGEKGDWRSWKSRGVVAVLTLAQMSAGVGSKAYNGELVGGKFEPRYPPGWHAVLRQKGRPNRGHLLANVLGGSGSDVRNIVTLFQAANLRMYVRVEQLVQHAYTVGGLGAECEIVYRVLPEYASEAVDYPSAMRIEARIRNTDDVCEGMMPWFNVSISNEPEPSVAFTYLKSVNGVTCAASSASLSASRSRSRIMTRSQSSLLNDSFSSLSLALKQ